MLYYSTGLPIRPDRERKSRSGHETMLVLWSGEDSAPAGASRHPRSYIACEILHVASVFGKAQYLAPQELLHYIYGYSIRRQCAIIHVHKHLFLHCGPAHGVISLVEALVAKSALRMSQMPLNSFVPQLARRL